jgi:ubiquinone/menaquinone biosynthesis C-methylase UbiE
MTEPDHPQKAHFSGIFHRASETYDAVGVDFFAPLAAQVVARADLSAGESVLDLGCGRGAALFAAADAVGPIGHALGIDLARGMVERTSLDAERRGLAQVRVELGDADHPPACEGGWDAAVAAFVLFFLPDPVATATRVREVLRPGGRFVLSTFDVSDDRWKVVESAVSPFWPPTNEPSHPATTSHFSSTAAVEELLVEAGFVGVDTVLVEHTSVYRDVQQWLDWTWSAGARVIWERVPEADLEAAQAAAYDVVSGLAEPDGTLREHFTVRVHRAVAP